MSRGPLTELERRLIVQIFSRTDAETARQIATERLHKGTSLAVLQIARDEARRLDPLLAEEMIARHTEAACAPRQTSGAAGAGVTIAASEKQGDIVIREV